VALLIGLHDRLSYPLQFCTIAIFLLSSSFFSAPWPACSAVMFTLAGVPIYYLSSYFSNRTSDAQRDRWFESVATEEVEEEGTLEMRKVGEELPKEDGQFSIE
jgi:hypothetical protein